MFRTMKDAVDYIQSRSNLGIKPGLSRVEEMLAYFNNPERKVKVVHIAGTNGKGSTLTYIKQALIENGYRVGTFTSPSMKEINDDIQVNNVSISDDAFVKLINKMLPIIEQLDRDDNPPTEFEIMVIACLLFFEDNVDVAIIETGMGGREDSTNCVNPLLTVLTTIGLDHIKFLGNSYEAIAYHKAGIIKDKVPVVVGKINGQAMRVIEDVAKEKQAVLFCYQKDFYETDRTSKDNGNEAFIFKSNELAIPLEIAMKGNHQITNATLACMALLQLKQLGFSIKFPLLKKGFLSASIPGRFEKIHSRPDVVVDGAHNTDGVSTFIDTVDRVYSHTKKRLIFAAFKDKPLEEMISHLDEHFEKVTFTTFAHERAATSDHLYSLSKNKGKQEEVDWQQAIERTLYETKEDEVIFITGSLKFIALVRSYFENK